MLAFPYPAENGVFRFSKFLVIQAPFFKKGFGGCRAEPCVLFLLDASDEGRGGDLGEIDPAIFGQEEGFGNLLKEGFGSFFLIGFF